MKNESLGIDEKVSALKLARLKLLSLHKTLIDEERKIYEKQHGKINSGQFLNLLLNEASFQWLRKFSTLVVQIDEMFDLNDGFTDEMVDEYLQQISELVMNKSTDEEFKNKFENSLNTLAEAALKNEEIISILPK